MSQVQWAALVGAVAAALLVTPVTSVVTGLSTYFSGCGQPYCGCGIPQDMLTDDHGKPIGFVALNAQWQGGPGPFQNGINCGRFVRITVGNGCTGGRNTDWQICIKGSTSGVANYDKSPDAIARSGKVLYAMVVDSCHDNNWWCRLSRYHLDISMSYLTRVFGSIALWNNRYVSWEYVASPPPSLLSMTKLKFAWGVGGSLKLYYLPLIVANTPNGIKAVDVLMSNGAWVGGQRNGPMGNQWKVATGKFRYGSGGRIQVRITAFGGSVARPYGKYWIPLPPNVQRVVPIVAWAA